MLLSRHTRRREFIAGLAGAAASPSVTRAQGAKVWRIGHVTVGPSSALQPLLQRHLASLGYAETVTFLNRAAPPAQVRDIIRELRPQIDLLVVWSTIGAVAGKKPHPTSRQCSFRWVILSELASSRASRNPAGI